MRKIRNRMLPREKKPRSGSVALKNRIRKSRKKRNYVSDPDIHTKFRTGSVTEEKIAYISDPRERKKPGTHWKTCLGYMHFHIGSGSYKNTRILPKYPDPTKIPGSYQNPWIRNSTLQTALQSIYTQ